MSRIPFFYRDEQVHDAWSFSMSPLKPGLIARRLALDPLFRVRGDFEPVSASLLTITHDAAHVDALIAGTEADGFGNKSAKDNLAIRYTVGNLLAAAEYQVPVSFSLTSGFHHAGGNFCGGFCTYEALTLAAEIEHRNNNGRTLIIDEDAHYGNGCVSQIEVLGMDAYCTYLQSAHTHVRYGVNLAMFAKQLDKVLERDKPTLILYQAGADNWAGDPLGGALSIEQLYYRDLIVLEAARRNNIRIVVNLAGGYAHDYEHTVRIHLNTAEAIKEVFGFATGAPFYPVSAFEEEATAL